MAIANKDLKDAIDAWPLDNEQKRFLEKATSGLEDTKASELTNLLREAEFAVVDCVASLSEMGGSAYATGNLALNGNTGPGSPAALSQRLNDLRRNIDRFLEGVGQDVSTGSQFPPREPIGDFRTGPQPPELAQLVLELVTLAQARQSSIAHGPVRTSDLERAPAPSPPIPAPPPMPGDQLKQVLDLLIAVRGKPNKPLSLGEVNGALGETIGQLLNGRKTAIGIVGLLMTELLTWLTTSPGAPGLGGLLGAIAKQMPGLGQFSYPIFLAFFVWGVLGKLEKWSQEIASSVKP